MKKLAIATDFSQQSDLAVKGGLSLAKMLSVPGVVFHWDQVISRIKNLDLIPDLGKMYKDTDGGNKIPAHLYEDFKEQLQRIGKSEKDISLEMVEAINFEDVKDYLDNLDKEGALVVAASDKDFLGRLLFGSFVEKAIFNTSQKVILLKNEVKAPIKKVGVCFDPIQDNERVLDEAIKMAKALNANIDIIHVESFDSREIYKNVFLTESDVEKNKNKYIVEKKELVKKKFAEYKTKIDAKGIKCEIDLIVTVDREPAVDLVKHLNKNPVDLLFIEPHPGFMKSFRFNSTSYDLIKHVPVNFVIIKEL
ncbi:MAG: universal stress protein [Halobacteriovoraceae bacterium]|nr:universal stress protein [Halobacteriovoraceae bacterium]